MLLSPCYIFAAGGEIFFEDLSLRRMNARVAVARRSNKESESNQKSVAGEGERGARQIRAHSALQCRNLIGEENSEICQVPYTKYFKMCFIQQTNL